MLVLGVSIPHHHKGDRHGRPSYVLVLVRAIRPRSDRGTAQLPSLAGPEAVTQPKRSMILVANSSTVVGVQVSPFADAPILPRFRPSLDFHGPVFRLSIGPSSIGNLFVSKSLPEPCVSSLDADVQNRQSYLGASLVISRSASRVSTRQTCVFSTRTGYRQTSNSQSSCRADCQPDDRKKRHMRIFASRLPPHDILSLAALR